MKIETKKIPIDIYITGGECSYSGHKSYDYRFTLNEHISQQKTVSLIIETNEPETMKEFLEKNTTTKKDLVKWLNKNYNE